MRDRHMQYKDPILFVMAIVGGICVLTNHMLVGGILIITGLFLDIYFGRGR